MTKTPLVFSQIRLRRLYGSSFEGTSLNDITPGVNVVYGPNAAGKTSLARIIQHVLWPDSIKEGRPEYSASFILDGATWHVEAIDGIPVLKRNGTESRLRDIPGSDDRAYYYLHLSDLFRADDKKFAEEIVRELAGGYDVSIAVKDAGFVKEPSYRNPKSVALATAKEHLSKLERERRRLLSEENRLSDLRGKCESLEQNAARLDLWEKLREFLREKRAREEKEERFGIFDRRLVYFSGDETRQLEEWQEELNEKERNLEENRKNQLRVESAIVQNPLAGRDLAEDFLQLLKKRLETVKAGFSSLKAAIETEKNAIKSLNVASGALGTHYDPSRLGTFTPDEFDELARRFAEYAAVEAKAQALEQKRQLFTTGHAAPELEIVSEAASHLVRWLSNDRSGAHASYNSFSMVLLLLAVVCAVASVSLWLWVDPLLWVLLIPAAIFAGLYLFMNTWQSSPEQQSARKDYESTGVQGPTTWDRPSVEIILANLERKRNTLWQAREEGRILQSVESEMVANDENLRKADTLRRQFASHLGLDPDVRLESLNHLVSSIRVFRKMFSDKVVAEDARARAESAWNTALAHLNTLLSTAELTPATDIETAESRVDLVVEADRNLVQLRREMDQLRDAHLMLVRELGRTKTRIAEKYASLEIAEGDMDAVRDLSRQVSEFQAAKKSLEEATFKESSAFARLELTAYYNPEFLNLEMSEIEKRRAEAENARIEEMNVREEISRIETSLQIERDRNDYTQAEQGVRMAEAELMDDRVSSLEKAAGWILGEFVRKETVEHQTPIVFEKAKTLFSRITAGRYVLRINPDSETLSAFDTVEEKDLTLDELSSGTRVQLLLSVRLAFVEEQESGVRLPILLDETLANSDDVRTKAMVQAIEEIARSGRQVFYFTAREDEVAKWELFSDGAVPFKKHPVSASVMPEDIPLDALPAVWNDNPIPNPDRVTRDELESLLEIPVWDSSQPAGRLPLWYLVEDPTSLANLANGNYAQWGQFSMLTAEVAETSFGLSKSEFTRIQALGEIVLSWAQLRRIGKGLIVDKAVLETSGQISDVFMDQVVRLNRELKGKGRELIDALGAKAIANFRRQTIEALEAYFVENGYISEEEPLTDDQLWSRLLNESHVLMSQNGLNATDISRVLARIAERAKTGL